MTNRFMDRACAKTRKIGTNQHNQPLLFCMQPFIRLFFLVIVLASAACIGRSESGDTPLVAVASDPVATATNTIVPATTVPSPTPTSTTVPTATPTQRPTATATATPTQAPTATRRSRVSITYTTSTPKPPPTATPVPITFAPSVAPWSAPESLPGLLSRSGGYIHSFTVVDETVWANIGGDLVGLDMLSGWRPRVLAELRLPFTPSRLFRVGNYVVGLEARLFRDEFSSAEPTRLFVVDVTSAETPQPLGIITDLAEIRLRPSLNHTLFLNNRAGSWYELQPERGLANLFEPLPADQIPERVIDDIHPKEPIIFNETVKAQLGSTRRRLFVLETDGVIFDDTIAYYNIHTQTSTVLVAVDISEQNAPTLINFFESFNTTVAGLTEQGLVTGFAGGGPEGGYTLLDLSNIAAPTIVDSGFFFNYGARLRLDGLLYAGDHPGLTIYRIVSPFELEPLASAESPRITNSIANQRIAYKHPDRNLLFLVNGTYVGEERNIEIVDLGNGLQPQFVSQIETRDIAGIAAHDDVLYVQQLNVLSRFDISDPAAPVSLGDAIITPIDAPVLRRQSSFRLTPQDDGRLIATVATADALLWLDLTAGAQPVELSRIEMPDACRTERSAAIHFSMQPNSSLMFVGFNHGPTHRYDVSDPTQLILIDELPFGGRFTLGDGLLFVPRNGRLNIYDADIILGTK